MQLLDLHQERFSSSDRAKIAIHSRSGFGVAFNLHIQHRRREASVLQNVRDQILLYSSISSRRLQCQCALPGAGDNQKNYSHTL